VINILFIDPHKDWLKFVKKSLSNVKGYEITTALDLDVLLESESENEGFDLIFIGMNLLRDNPKTMNELTSSSWCFIVLFPGFPDQETARVMFKLGARDIFSKPYDAESLKKMIEEEIVYCKRKHKKEDIRSRGNYKEKVRQFKDIFSDTRPIHRK
jgi:DNA-binding NtrC family response regulator